MGQNEEASPAVRDEARSFPGLLGPFQQRGHLRSLHLRLGAVEDHRRVEPHRLVHRLDAAEQSTGSASTVRSLAVNIVGLNDTRKEEFINSSNSLIVQFVRIE